MSYSVNKLLINYCFESLSLYQHYCGIFHKIKHYTTITDITVALLWSHVQRIVPIHSSDKLLLPESLWLSVETFPDRVHRR